MERLRVEGYEVFLDLKLHDIPNTVAQAVHSLLALEPALLTIHATGGAAMLDAAARAVHGTSTRLLAVTVLTSTDHAQLAATGVRTEPAAQVLRLATLAHNNGVSGIVCSALEAAALRQAFSESYLVTPGIRPHGAAQNDQQRVMSPADALGAGATQLVIGRPITAAAAPAAAYLGILSEIAHALPGENDKSPA